MDKTTLVLKNLYKANVSTLAAGSELIAVPCIVYDITVSSDAAGDATINISNTITSYSSTYRLAKIKTTDENQTIQLTFPGGKRFTTGVCATANKASVDVSITYE